jgi:hypothetical protein
MADGPVGATEAFEQNERRGRQYSGWSEGSRPGQKIAVRQGEEEGREKIGSE